MVWLMAGMIFLRGRLGLEPCKGAADAGMEREMREPGNRAQSRLILELSKIEECALSPRRLPAVKTRPHAP